MHSLGVRDLIYSNVKKCVSRSSSSVYVQFQYLHNICWFDSSLAVQLGNYRTLRPAFLPAERFWFPDLYQQDREPLCAVLPCERHPADLAAPSFSLLKKKSISTYTFHNNCIKHTANTSAHVSIIDGIVPLRWSYHWLVAVLIHKRFKLDWVMSNFLGTLFACFFLLYRKRLNLFLQWRQKFSHF